MFLTSQMIFHLLSHKYALHRWESATADVPVRMAMLYRGQTLEPGRLYLLDELTDFTSVHPVEGCAFLILSSAPMNLPEPYTKADAAFVTDGISKLDLFDEVNDLISALLEWDLSLRDACAAGALPQKIMELGGRFLKVPLVLYDGERRVSRSTGDSPAVDVYDLFLDVGYRLHPGSEAVTLYPEEGGEEQTLCKNILLDGEVIAVFLALCGREEVSQGERDLFAHLARYVTAAHLNDVSCGRVCRKNDEQHKALSRILYQESYRVTPEDRAALSRFDWREEHEYLVVFMRPIWQMGSVLDGSYLRCKLEGDWPDSCLLPDGKEFAWILNLTRGGSKLQEIREYLTGFIREHMMQVGLSNPMPGLTGLPNLYQQACAVLSIGLRKNPHLWLFAFSDYLLDYIFDKFSCELSAEQAIHRGIYRLMAYDAENSTDYVETLKTYIEHQFNASLAAEKLFVHRSTFLRRIRRIEEVAGIRLDDPDEILHIMISLRLCQLLPPRQAKACSVS